MSIYINTVVEPSNIIYDNTMPYHITLSPNQQIQKISCMGLADIERYSSGAINKEVINIISLGIFAILIDAGISQTPATDITFGIISAATEISITPLLIYGISIQEANLTSLKSDAGFMGNIWGYQAYNTDPKCAINYGCPELVKAPQYLCKKNGGDGSYGYKYHYKRNDPVFAKLMACSAKKVFRKVKENYLTSGGKYYTGAGPCLVGMAQNWVRQDEPASQAEQEAHKSRWVSGIAGAINTCIERGIKEFKNKYSGANNLLK